MSKQLQIPQPFFRDEDSAKYFNIKCHPRNSYKYGRSINQKENDTRGSLLILVATLLSLLFI